MQGSKGHCKGTPVSRAAPRDQAGRGGCLFSVDAIFTADYPVIMASTVVLVIRVVAMNFAQWNEFGVGHGQPGNGPHDHQ